MPYVELVAILAVFQFIAFGTLAGMARAKSGLKAPKMTGDEGFERMYRVQMNTLETIAAFLPALFIAARYWPAYVVAGLGAIYLIGRMFYWRGYITDPKKRSLGFMLSMVPTIILNVMALIGVVMALLT